MVKYDPHGFKDYDELLKTFREDGMAPYFHNVITFHMGVELYNGQLEGLEKKAWCLKIIPDPITTLSG